jgi:cation diffusion facilitator family transporter
MDDAKATQYVLRVGMLSDVLLFSMKSAGSLYTGSSGLVADAAHSLADLSISMVVMLTSRIASKAPDSQHPFSYGKADSIGSLFCGSTLFVTGIGILYKAALDVRSCLLQEKIEPLVPTFFDDVSLSEILANPYYASLAIGLCGVSVLVKEVLYQLTAHIGKKVRSQALIANAHHHRADALTSIVAGLGIFGTYYNFPVLDSMGGVIISAIIARTGFDIAFSSIRELMDGKLDQELINDCIAVCCNNPEVKSVLSARARRYGPNVIVDISLYMHQHIPLSAAFAITESIKQKLFSQHPELAECNIVTLPITGCELLNRAVSQTKAETVINMDPVSLAQVEAKIKDAINANSNIRISSFNLVPTRFDDLLSSTELKLAVRVAFTDMDSLTLRQAVYRVRSIRGQMDKFFVQNFHLGDISIDLETKLL